MRWVGFGILVLVSWVGFHYGDFVKLEDQWPYFEALRTTTSIVFGIMGALLAIVYPEVIKQGLRPSGGISFSDPEVHRVSDPLAYSALMLVVLVVAAPAFAWIKSLEFAKDSTAQFWLQKGTFSLLCALSYGQICILMSVLNPLGLIVDAAKDSSARRRLRQNIHRDGIGD